MCGGSNNDEVVEKSLHTLSWSSFKRKEKKKNWIEGDLTYSLQELELEEWCGLFIFMALEWLGYIGVFFAVIYRIPQVVKLYRTKKGADVSKKSFMLHNGAYVSLILYISLSKPKMDYILMGYYVTGLVQNILIILLKQYYKNYRKIEGATPTPDPVDLS